MSLQETPPRAFRPPLKTDTPTTDTSGEPIRPDYESEAPDNGTSRPKVFKGEARVFRSDLWESFSKVHPATPAFVGIPIIAFCLFRAITATALTLPALIGLMIAGYVVWTFFEYWLHRLLFHMPVFGPFTARLHFLVHGVHHDYPWDPTRMVIPPVVSVTLGVGFYFLFEAVFGAAGYPLFAGFVVGYLFYDLGHWYLHERAPKSRLGKWLRREHMIHHFRDPETRFGVSCPWMDYLFGTAGPTTPRESGASRV